MSIERQRIGRQGEKLFGLLCTEAGVTCNKSIEDDYGWDMLIEFPPPADAKGPIDLRPGQLTASVQVKATQVGSRSCRISLQNALRMAKSPIPSFIFLAVLKDRKNPRYFVVHVWSDLIGAWLKAGRDADARGITAINKETVKVDFSHLDEHTEDALAWIEDQIRSVPNYAATKSAIVGTVGFESGYGVAQVSLELDSPRDFVDLQLGLKSSVHATRFQFHSERFGIRAAHPEIDLEDVEFSFTPEGISGNLRFTFPTGRVVSLDARFYNAVGAEGDKATLNAWRFKTRCFDLVYTSDDRMQARANIRSTDVVPFEEIALFASLQATPASTPIRLDVELKGIEIPLGNLTLDEKVSVSGWENFDLAVDALRDVCVAAAKPPPELSIKDLNRAASDLSLLSSLASERTMLLDFMPNPGIPQEFKWFLAYALATVGDYTFGSVVRRPITDDERDGDRRRIFFGPAKLLSSYVGARGTVTHEGLQNAYEQQLDRLSSEGEIMGVGDIRNVVSEDPGDHELQADLPTSRRLPT